MPTNPPEMGALRRAGEADSGITANASETAFERVRTFTCGSSPFGAAGGAPGGEAPSGCRGAKARGIGDRVGDKIVRRNGSGLLCAGGGEACRVGDDMGRSQRGGVGVGTPVLVGATCDEVASKASTRSRMRRILSALAAAESKGATSAPTPTLATRRSRCTEAPDTPRALARPSNGASSEGAVTLCCTCMSAATAVCVLLSNVVPTKTPPPRLGDGASVLTPQSPLSANDGPLCKAAPPPQPATCWAQPKNAAGDRSIDGRRLPSTAFAAACAAPMGC